MTRRFTLDGIPFEWDANKAATNWQKHRINFETACEAFFDPFVRPGDPGKDSDEARQALVGLSTAWKLLFVVYVERGDGLRILSARPATSAERKSYEDL